LDTIEMTYLDVSSIGSWHVSGLALNHQGLGVLVHPNTDDELRDHRDCALWFGQSHQRDLQAVVG
jgi:DOPA 4,5-dioxygenase